MDKELTTLLDDIEESYNSLYRPVDFLKDVNNNFENTRLIIVGMLRDKLKNGD